MSDPTELFRLAIAAAQLSPPDTINADGSIHRFSTNGKGWRLAAAIKTLGYLGWEPDSVRVKCSEWGNKIARYSLPAKAKQAAQAMRQQGGAHE